MSIYKITQLITNSSGNEELKVLHPVTEVGAIETTDDKQFISSTEKTKLSGIATGATKDSITVATSGSDTAGNLLFTFYINGTATAVYSPKGYVYTFSDNSVSGTSSGFKVSGTDGSTYTFTIGLASTTKEGLMSKTDKSNLNTLNTNFGSYTVTNAVVDGDTTKLPTGEAVYEAIKTAVSKVYKYKGSVATYANLPTSSVENGDVYNVEAAYSTYPAGTNFAAVVDASNNITWDPLGGSVDLSTYAKTADLTDGTITVKNATNATNANVTVTKSTSTTNGDTITVQVGSGTSGSATITNAKYAASSGSASTATTATNLASAPSVQAGTTDTSKITVTAGGKTSSEFTVPYATSAGSATSATSAGKLTTGRSITVSVNNGTSSATGSATFDGSADKTISVTLPNAVTAGTYSAVTVNTKGIVTSGAQMIEVGTVANADPSDSLATGGIYFQLVE